MRATKEIQAKLHHDDETDNTSGNASLMDIVDARLSRRNLMRVSLGTAGSAVLGALPLAACGGGGGGSVPRTPIALATGFAAVARSTSDAVTVPAGYTATVLYAMGDPLSSATPDFRNDGTDTGFDNRAGDSATRSTTAA